MKKFIPVLVFVLLIGLLAFGLTNDPKKVPSPFIGKTAPAFSTQRLYSEEPIGTEQMRGQVWLLNVFASWCVSCRAEHKLITQLAATPGIQVVGLNYKDEEKDARDWLRYFGNPYDAVAIDRDGKIGIEYGVYGVPETFVIDRQGIIRYKQIGPVTQAALTDTILPLLDELKSE